MELKEVLATLGYDQSPNFLSADQLASDPDNAHIYRKAEEECGLSGVYTLRGSQFEKAQANIPIVYVCQAQSEQGAAEIHRQVWNQNIVPFVLVVSPKNIRLYSGFRFAQPVQRQFGDQQTGVLSVISSFNEISSSLAAFRAESIDAGNVWREWGTSVTPETRVDWELLANLERLDDWLMANGVDDRSLSHAIIGKFVYLRYLRDRQILSDRKLGEWGIGAHDVFSRDARLESFKLLIDGLDDWLNGSVFPIADYKIRQLGVQRLRQVAAVFQGDTLYGQLHLDFNKYDFSFIPIETLSVIYQQFLHGSERKSGKSKGRLRGAYYTPVPLVNFMLDQLETRRPLNTGMRVIDPSCGSGVFLVQCYRRLIEQQVRQNKAIPKPVKLRDLLTDHIFGIDTDSDACQIAELSLILTLLDYVKPPDLTNTRFKLPALTGKNIFHANAFDNTSELDPKLFRQLFDWVVGNPPWIELNGKELDPLDQPIYQWMQANKDERPTGGNQVAEAFAWRACDFAAPRAVVGLLIPAMTFFKYESKAFRESFFEKTDVWAVANFSNLAEVLFAGRSRVPAAALFYSYRHRDEEQAYPDTVEVYSPLVANQVVHDPGRSGRRLEIWSIVINASEMREIKYSDVVSGDALPWKMATWGSPFDNRLLSTVSSSWPTLEELEEEGDLIISEGLQLRSKADKKPSEKLEPHPELAGKPMLDVDPLKKRRYLFRLPEASIARVPADETYVRKGRFTLPFSVCTPPHVLVGASRNFAVFHNGFLIVPPRQIGIGSKKGDETFLKALALYLNSDFAIYHQFLTSPQLGIKRDVATLQALRSIPVPFTSIDSSALAQWEHLYHRTQSLPDFGVSTETLDDGMVPTEFSAFLQDLNDLTNEALKLDVRQRAAVHDLVHIRLALIDGKVGQPATRTPRKDEMETYARMLQAELDDFLGDDVAARHRIKIVCDQDSGMVEIELVRNTVTTQLITVLEAGSNAASEFGRARGLLRQERSQWVYFDRNLRIYDGTKTYLFKPMRRMHWAVSQAMTDASEVIADTLQQDPAPLEGVAG